MLGILRLLVPVGVVLDLVRRWKFPGEIGAVLGPGHRALRLNQHSLARMRHSLRGGLGSFVQAKHMKWRVWARVHGRLWMQLAVSPPRRRAQGVRHMDPGTWALERHWLRRHMAAPPLLLRLTGSRALTLAFGGGHRLAGPC